MQYYGVDAMIRIVSHVLFIYVSFWALQSIRVDQFFKSFKTQQIQLVMLFLSTALGFTVSSFILEFIALFKNLFFTFFQ